MRIMTVCLGNICRSPAAEAVLNRKLAEAGLDDVEVTSAGTSDEHVGARPHHLTREVGGNWATSSRRWGCSCPPTSWTRPT